MSADSFVKIGEAKVESLGAVAELYLHKKHGCPFLNIKNDDTNNFFSISFKTAPSNDKGTPHVTEHMVLHGSKKYPVTEVYGEIKKRSICTYLNAFTYPDLTCYPVGSANEVDFHNLIDVYMDCVLNPTFRLENFLSETFHREFQKDQDPTTPLINAGVVFNEMKGVFSSPDNFFEDMFTMNVLKGTLYQNNYGGDPNEIKKLTRDELVDFHKKFYHPSNSLIYHYGSFDKEKIMKHVDEMLDPIPKSEFVMDPNVKWIPEPRKEPETIVVDGPFDSSQEPEKQIRAAVAWLIGEATDRVLFNDFDLIESILVGSKGTPLVESLIKSGIGAAFQSSGFNAYTREMYFSVGLKGMSKEGLEKLESTTIQTLQKLVDEGISKDMIEAALHQIFIHTKMISAKQGLNIFCDINHPWEHGVNPLDIIDRTKELEELRERALKPGYLEKIIEEKLIKNQNRVKFIVNPSPAFNEKAEIGEKTELEEIRKKMTPEDDKKCVELAQTLKDVIMNKNDSVKTLPCFKKQDLDPNYPRFPTEISSNITKITQPTNGITSIGIRIKTPIQQSINLKLLHLLTKAMNDCGTKTVNDLAFGQMKQRYVSSVNVDVDPERIENNPNETSIITKIRVLCLTENLEKALEIIRMIIYEPNLDNLERLKVIISDQTSSINDVLTSMGSSLALDYASRTESRPNAIREQTEGGTMLRYLRDVVAKKDINDVSKELKDLFNTLMSTSTATAFVTTSEKDMKIVAPKIEEFVSEFNQKHPHEPIQSDYTLIDKYIEQESNRDKVFFAYDSQTSFLACSTPIPYFTKEVGKITVATELLSHEFINPEIRQKLGAYGAYAIVASYEPNFEIYTYRDGAPTESYAAILRVLETSAEKVTDEMVDNAILKVVSGQDRPKAPTERGVNHILNGTSPEKYQMIRDSALSATKEEVVEEINKLKAKKFMFAAYGNKTAAPDGFIVEQF